MAEIIWRHPGWAPTEMPKLPGSPATLDHGLPMRALLAAISLLCSLTGNIGNSMLIATLPTIQGNLSLTPVEGQWLLAAFTMTNCWANLILFKFRIQYGIRLFVRLTLGAYAAIALFSIFVQDFETALVVRAASGLAAAPLTTFATLYMIQAAGYRNIPRGAMIGISLSQLVSPLAYVLAPAMIDLARPGLQYMFEAGLALCVLAATVLVPLPYGERWKVFERADTLTIALLGPGVALLVAVLSQGRTQWWTDWQWIGMALAGSLALIVAGLIREYRRHNPLLMIGWLGTPALLRFMFGAVLIRLLTAEQTVGAVGFLRAVGMGPDQLAVLYAVVLAATVAGLLTVVFVGRPVTVMPMLAVSVLLIGIGALLDRDATPLDRPHDFFLSQALIGYASALFVGPVFLAGLQQALKGGINYVLTLIVIFSFSQALGLQLGSAALGTYQLFREHEYSGVINAGVDPGLPIVQQRLMIQGHVYSGVLTDPARRTAEGVAGLGQSATLSANTLGYDDVFTVLAILAFAYFVWTLFITRRMHKAMQTSQPAQAGQ